MATIKDMIIIEDMQAGDSSPIGRVEVQPVESDETCIQVWDMDGDNDPQSIWFDREGAALLRNYISKWLGDDVE